MACVRLLLMFGLVLSLAAPPALCADQVPEGTYKLSYFQSPTVEVSFWLIKLESKDGQVNAVLVYADPRAGGPAVESASVEGDQLRIVLKGPGGELSFQGRIPGKDAGKVLGSFGDDRRLFMAQLTPTEKQKLEQKEVVTQHPPSEAMQKAMARSLEGRRLRFQAQQTEDANEKGKLLAQAKEAEEKARTEVPKLYQEVLAKSEDPQEIYYAGINLLQSAARTEAKPEQVQKWAKAMMEAAQPFGSRWQQQVALQIAEQLVAGKGAHDLALEYAQQAKELLDAKALPARQVSVLKALARAQRQAGKEAEAGQTEAQLAKVEETLDREYLAKMPPFKPASYDGRKGKSTRTVVMELFTGAQCPPCVAADVAFDALMKTYKPSEVVFIQYHMHIPGPDPMTNPASEARWNYYRQEFPQGIRGTPSTLFNGKPLAGGGGPLARAEVKYGEYRQIIDEQLEQPAGARIQGNAERRGDQIDIQVEVADLDNPGPSKKLYLVLVEETVRYVGGNNLRFHHNVVRALPGGTEGMVLKEKQSKHQATVDLKELRRELNRYLDDYAANQAPFPNPDRPLDLKNLRVIALVQDDQTREILQGARIEVGGEGSGEKSE